MGSTSKPEQQQPPTKPCHVVAIPYPGRGHVNPMINLCTHLTLKNPNILITFILTEEWLSLISSYAKPANIRYATIPNVIPSEQGRAENFQEFLEAVFTKMEAPFERLLDGLDEPVNAIIADTYLRWVVDVGNRRNVPVVSLWTMSASVFAVFQHFDLIVRNGHFPAELSERGDEKVDYIPGLPPTRLVDFPTIFHGQVQEIMKLALACIPPVAKAQYLLFTSFYELEPQVIDALKSEFSFPVYSVGPTIPNFESKDSPYGTTDSQKGPNYLDWLDSQPNGSVLYVSLGSFLSVSGAQMDEIVAGIQNSGVRYLWVSRDDTLRFNEGPNGNEGRGMVVPWCDQLRVLQHSSVGAFWSHCGFNSTLEAVYSGVPVLAFPIFWDQVPNSKNIEDDWKVGWRVKKKAGDELAIREEISELVKRFMDLNNEETREIRQRAKEYREKCLQAIGKGGSTDANLDAFIKDITQARS
ncbi:hypothetical protein ACFE04_012492 [Oxalis oulophora]